MGHRASGNTRYSEELVKYRALKEYGNQYWPIHSSILAWRTPLTEKPGKPHSTGSQEVGRDQKDRARIDARSFLPVAALPL